MTDAERIAGLEAEVAVLRDILNTPVVEPFAMAAAIEAKHQRLRRGDPHDEAKDAFDWFWTLGYLGGKAARAHNDGDIAKALHHTITAAALLANWHRHLIFRRNEKPAPIVYLAPGEEFTGFAHGKSRSEHGGSSQ